MLMDNYAPPGSLSLNYGQIAKNVLTKNKIKSFGSLNPSVGAALAKPESALDNHAGRK